MTSIGKHLPIMISYLILASCNSVGKARDTIPPENRIENVSPLASEVLETGAVIQITIRQDDRVFLQGQSVLIEDLSDQLAILTAGQRATPIHIETHPEAKTRTVIQVRQAVPADAQQHIVIRVTAN